MKYKKIKKHNNENTIWRNKSKKFDGVFVMWNLVEKNRKKK